MEIIRLPAEMTSWSNGRIAAGGTIALVPTMGFLHDGHLGLMKNAGRLAETVVASIFVNPIQFGPNEDFDRYPRAFERDTSLAEAAGVDVLFAPETGDMYGCGSQTRISVGALTEGLCGAVRPGHFDGVTTVVAKLFNIVKPHVAIFGRKDYQQLVVIRQMVRDLNWDIRIIAHPIVREADGLAMSSRNAYLSEGQRKSAVSLVKGGRLARTLVAQGEKATSRITGEVKRFLASFEEVAVEYVIIVHKESLAVQSDVDENSIMAVAARVGTTRLIDNFLLVGAEDSL